MNNQSIIIENIIQNLSLELYLPMSSVVTSFKQIETKLKPFHIIVGTIFDAVTRQHHNVNIKNVNTEEQSNGKTALAVVTALDEQMHTWLSNQASNFNVQLANLSAVVIYLPINMSFSNLTDNITKTLTRRFKMKDETDEKNTNNFNIKIVSETNNQHMVIYYSVKDKTMLEWISSLSNTSDNVNEESIHYSLSRAYRQIFIESVLSNLKTVLASKKHPKSNSEIKPEEQSKDSESIPEDQPEDQPEELKKKGTN